MPISGEIGTCPCFVLIINTALIFMANISIQVRSGVQLQAHLTEFAEQVLMDLSCFAFQPSDLGLTPLAAPFHSVSDITA